MPPKRKREAASLASSSAHEESSAQQTSGAEEAKRQRKPVERLIDTIDQPSSGGSSAAAKGSTNVSGVKVTIHPTTEPLPKRNKNGEFVFPDFPAFKPNLSPKEVLQLGSFGGTYFRVITSGVTGETYRDAWTEFPADWFEKLDIKKQVSSQTYRNEVNLYEESCGGDLQMWEGSGWITHIDPFGWFQWYCRFYLGRRSSDDQRQVARGLGVMGQKGRWRNNLVNKCLASGQSLEAACDNYKIAPKVRQLLQHWGYRLTVDDLKAAQKSKPK